MATYTTNYNLEKPEATDPFGDFLESYNDNLDTIDANLGGGGGGGGDTVSWTQIEQSGTKIAEIDINGTSQDVYAPSGGGGGSLSLLMGAELLWEGSFTGAGTIDVPNLDDYLLIAVQNDVSVLVIGNSFTGDGALGTYGQAQIQGFAYRFDNSVANKLTINANNRGIIRSNGNSTAYGGEWCVITKIYGLVKKVGKSGIFAPVIYSDVERKVGVWRDNKPLYQITIVEDNPTKQNLSGKYYYSSQYTKADIEYAQLTSISVYDSYYSRWYNLPYDRVNVNENVDFMATTNTNGYAVTVSFNTSAPAYNITKIRYTIQYTKTTDVAGSGDYNTYGVPTVHYDTTEQVIGTWMGKPLYQKSIPFSGINTVANTWYSLNISSYLDNPEIVFNIADMDYYFVSGVQRMFSEISYEPPNILFKTPVNRTNISGHVTVRYTKTTD